MNSDELKRRIGDEVEDARDRNRPTMETVLHVCKLAFEDDPTYKTMLEFVGPDTWMWEDLTMQVRGLPKFYVLTRSTEPDTLGHPLLSIRQAYSIRLDTWVTTSQLLMGPDVQAVARSLALAIANQTGAFAGFRRCITEIVKANGDPMAGINAATAMMHEDDAWLLSEEGIAQGDILTGVTELREVDPKDAN